MPENPYSTASIDGTAPCGSLPGGRTRTRSASRSAEGLWNPDLTHNRRIGDLRVLGEQEGFAEYDRKCAVPFEWQEDTGVARAGDALPGNDAEVLIIGRHQNV